jgi:excisionase family DNA binding protein
MPRTKKQPESTPNSLQALELNGGRTLGEVLTLPEAASYLRLSEADVLRLVEDQWLPTRRLGNEWRFLKTAIQRWLGTSVAKGQKQGIWAAAGMLKDDPFLEEMLKDIDRMRGRPVTEED